MRYRWFVAAVFCVLCGLLSQPVFAQTDFEKGVPDPHLRDALRDALGKSLAELAPSDFASLLSLSAEGRGIQDLRGLQAFPNLEHLDLENNRISDLNPILGLQKLRSLGLIQNPLPQNQAQELNSARFPLLRRLSLGSAAGGPRHPGGLRIEPILETLSTFRNLESLSLWGFDDLDDDRFGRLFETLLTASPGLAELQLPESKISDASLSKISRLSGLRMAAFWGVKGLTDFSALRPLGQLQALWVNSTGLTDLKSVAALYEAGAFHDAGGERILDVRFMKLDLTPGTPDRLVVDRLLGAGVKVEFVGGNLFQRPVFPLAFFLTFMGLAIVAGVFVAVRSPVRGFLTLPLHLAASLLWVLVLGGVVGESLNLGERLNQSAATLALAALNLSLILLVCATISFRSLKRSRAVALVLAGFAVAALFPLLSGYLAVGRMLTSIGFAASALTLMVLLIFEAPASTKLRNFVLAACALLAAGAIVEALPQFGIAFSEVTGVLLWIVVSIFEAGLLSVAFLDASRELEKAQAAVQERITRDQRLTELGTIASKIAHEINNPNHVIVLQLAVLRRMNERILEAFTEKARQADPIGPEDPHLELIRAEIPGLLNGIDQASRQIATITETVRAGVVRPKGRFEPVDLCAVVGDTARLYAARVNTGTGRFSLHLPSKPVMVAGSYLRLQQLFLNLLNNALVSLESRRGGVEVRVEERAEASAEPCAVLVIRDEGRGMTADTLARLGEPFFSTRHDAGGTGLGLSVCFDVAKEHRGKLSFESESGTGTTVTLVMPLHRGGRPQDQHAPP